MGSWIGTDVNGDTDGTMVVGAPVGNGLGAVVVGNMVGDGLGTNVGTLVGVRVVGDDTGVFVGAIGALVGGDGEVIDPQHARNMSASLGQQLPDSVAH